MPLPQLQTGLDLTPGVNTMSQGLLARGQMKRQAEQGNYLRQRLQMEQENMKAARAFELPIKKAAQLGQWALETRSKEDYPILVRKIRAWNQRHQDSPDLQYDESNLPPEDMAGKWTEQEFQQLKRDFILATSPDKVVEAFTRKPDVPNSEIELIRAAQAGDEQARRILSEHQQNKVDLAIASGQGRVQGYGDVRVVNVVDPENNEVIPITVNELRALRSQGKIPKTPQYDFETLKTASTARTAGGRLTVARKQNIVTAFGLLDDLEKTNQKLDYSPAKFVGMVEKWKNGQLNDPVFTEYMTQRADTLFVLGNALKQNGLTDKAIEVEEEAFTPTLSPKAFKGWVNSQRRALNRAAKEMGTDFGYDIPQADVTEAGVGGQGKRSKQIEPAAKPDTKAVTPQTGKTVTAQNPTTGEMETWDIESGKRIK